MLPLFLAALAPASALAAEPAQPAPDLAKPGLIAGSFQPAPADLAARSGSRPGWIWHSNNPDSTAQGRLELPLPPLPDSLPLLTAGYPNHATLRIDLVQPGTDRVLKLAFRSAPGPDWTLYHWDIPPAWRGRPAMLVARDESSEQWIGIGIPDGDGVARTHRWKALWQVLAATALTALPFFTALALLRRWCGGDPPLHVALALAASGVFALAVFFGYFFARGAGHAVLLTGAAAVLWAAWRTWREARLNWSRGALAPDSEPNAARAPRPQSVPLRSLLSALGSTLAPLLATLLLAIAVAGSVYLYGGDQSPGEVPSGRHDLNLPNDNVIPEYFAERIYNREPLRPFLIDWLTSDRPPLQAGYLLQSRPLLIDWPARMAAAMACQFAALAGLWVLLGAIRLPRSAAQLTLLACATSGFFVVNTVFAWPKLLPAGFLLAATGLLWRLARDRRHATVAEAVALGACAALAMLGHGGSFFALAALAAVHLFLHAGWRDWRLLAFGGGMAIVVYAPWMAYQKFVDPPGDRLVKYHLAGRTAVDPRGSLTVIAEAYRQTPVAEIVRNKLSNFRVLAGDFTRVLPGLRAAAGEASAGEWRRAWWRTANAVQGGAFFHLLQALGILALGLPGIWLARRRQPQLAAAGGYLVLVAATSIVVWCLLMFGPEGSVVHQGSYLTGALLLVAGMLGLTAAGGYAWRSIVLGMHFLVFLGLWTFSPAWNPWQDVIRPALEPFWLAVFVASGAALLWLGRRLPCGSEPSGDVVPPADR